MLFHDQGKVFSNVAPSRACPSINELLLFLIISFLLASWWNILLIKPYLYRKLCFRGHHRPEAQRGELLTSEAELLSHHPKDYHRIHLPLRPCLHWQDVEVPIGLPFAEIALRLAQSSRMIGRRAFPNKLCIPHRFLNRSHGSQVETFGDNPRFPNTQFRNYYL